MAHIRRDARHRLTARLSATRGTVVVAGLNVFGMARGPYWRRSLEARLIDKVARDTQFRGSLLRHPTATVRRELSAITGSDGAIAGLRDRGRPRGTAHTFHLVPLAVPADASELSDAELAGVAAKGKSTDHRLVRLELGPLNAAGGTPYVKRLAGCLNCQGTD